MEEVDGIIIHTLRQINCDIDDSIDSLKSFTTEIVFEATVKCLKLMLPDLNVSHHLPPSMSARFRVGSQLAQACLDLGYQGEIGYQTFLYFGETDIRKVFIFLIEKLPKETEKVTDQQLGAIALLDKAIANTLQDRLRLPWLPRFHRLTDGRYKSSLWFDEGASSTCEFHSSAITFPHDLEDLNKKIPKDVKTYYLQHQPLLTAQPPHPDMVLPSVINHHGSCLVAEQEWENEWNQFGLPTRLSEKEYKSKKKQRIQHKITDILKQEMQKLPALSKAPTLDAVGVEAKTSRVKGSRFTHSEKLQFTKEENLQKTLTKVGKVATVPETEDQLRKQDEELKSLVKEFEDIGSKVEKLELDNRKFQAGIQLMEQDLLAEEDKQHDMETTYKVKKQTLDLLPNADQNLAKLKEVIEGSTKRLVILANQWEKHRVPLIEEYRQLKEVNFNKLSETQRKLEEIKSMREKMKEIADDAQHKEQLFKQLRGEYEKTVKDINRAAYTRRILEIVSNIKKQKEDIDKVLVDTKEVQKEINQLTGKLDRTFTVTDELVFRDAKKDEAVRKAYKYLAALHESCSQLIKTVEETGAIMREIRDLEDQIENENQKKAIANLERITADYKQMKQENLIHLAKLKELSN